MFPNDEIRIHLEDTEWPLDYIDHDRLIARAIVCDDAGQLYFVRAERDDIFGPATVIETAGGGVEPGEDPDSAILRELQEELGVHTEILCRIGIVDDYYHLVHRHNINHYYLCRILSFGERVSGTPTSGHLMPRSGSSKRMPRSDPGLYGSSHL